MVKFTSKLKRKIKVGIVMDYKNNQVRKVCGFYVNESHLTNILLPHINRRIKEGVTIITILEDDLINNVKELLSRINLNQDTQEKILEINWTRKQCKYSQIKEQLNEKDVNKIDIIIKGSKEYIEIANLNIEKAIKNVQGKEINVINCYEIGEDKDIDYIIENYDFKLETSGLKKIEKLNKTRIS